MLLFLSHHLETSSTYFCTQFFQSVDLGWQLVYNIHILKNDLNALPGVSSWYLGSLLASVTPAAVMSPVDLNGVGVAPILDSLPEVSSLELKHTP